MPENQLDYLEINPDGAPKSTVIWLHGLGADGYDFKPIVSELKLPPDLEVRFVFPHAPMRPITINGGLLMRGWYDVRSMDFTTEGDEEGIRESERLIRDLIQQEIDAGIEPHRIVLAGFSQGGVISLQTGLRYSEKIAGILALSAYLPLPTTTKVEASPKNFQTPIFMAHGSFDMLIPLTAGEISKERLEASGYPVEWKIYPMEHSVCAQEVQDISSWLQKVLK